MDVRGPVIMFRNEAAGYFLEPEPPREPGAYRYMPYRSAEHQEMHDQLEGGDPPRCYYEADGARVHFTVVGAPEHRVLELADFAADAPAEPRP